MRKLEAVSRSTAQSLAINPIPDYLGNEECKVYTKGLTRRAYRSYRSLGTKDGLTLGWFKGQGTYTFVLSDASASVVAYLKIGRNLYGVPGIKGAVTAVFVQEQYRGQKLSTVLHLGALHVLKRLVSDSTMALGALLTWRSLEKFSYKIKLWCVTYDKQVDFEWGPNLPIIWGKPMDKLREEFVFYI